MPKINHRYCCNYTDDLVELLERNRVKFSISDFPSLSQRLVEFNICHADVANEKLNEEIRNTKITCFVTKVFSKKEMDSATWFSLWCDNMKIEEMPDMPAHEYHCRINEIYAAHREQKRPFTLRKSVNWGANRNFVAAMGECTLLFSNMRAKQTLLQHNINGVVFGPVNRFSTGIPFDDMFQIIVTNILPRDALVIEEADNCRKSVCEICGREQYRIDGSFQLKVKESYLQSNVDAYATEKMFGAGFARREVIVSRKFYEITRNLKLDRTIHFEPILLV